ncbi:tetratricopeptide repeat protein [Terracoccus sp. 273MFTsu3.1]|uniref:ATP-binding protein n=1 Tax=Terracoccus sp. 273MFTsu3.1 TaxID=1172188 RepID=UPI00036E93A1|nr:tetratricopeptide repeat protein [Terracoccus sp. 273MFTsu3.1]
MRELPSGTVTMLFSDIEGSTLMLSRLGRRYTDALDGHRDVLRSAWSAHGGTEMGTEGDSFFVVFPTAEGAVRAAVQAQRGLQTHGWPGDERVRVRMGIHTGSPQVHDDDYVGMDVHRAARIASSAHGGQAVLSSVAAELARDSLPDGVGLRDLGLHRLKDIPEPERLFQLTVDGLQVDFPALRTLGAASRLPVPATHLVGREHAVAELVDLVRSPEIRLVTLSGPGGSGKTRLAIEVAKNLVTAFPDGVFFVPLASATTPEVAWTTLGDVLEVPRNSRQPPRVFGQVANRAALFVLDSLEQLAEADEVVSELLEAAPRSAVVATSRRSLALPGEHLYPVTPLGLPTRSTVAAAEESPAVQLFLQQSRSVRPDFRLTPENVDAVVAICRRLDGLPLAIEISAARTRLLGPQALLRRIDTTLDLPSTSRQGPLRHRTLRETIAWSYDLLPESDQAFFRRLGVFAGGAALESVAAVALPAASDDRSTDPLDLVADLVDASLGIVTEAPDGEPRITLLDTIRSFALAELRGTGQLDDARAAHATHYLDVAERLKVTRDSDHLLALGQAEVELDNFREALTWGLRHGGAVEGIDVTATATALRLVTSLGWLWYTGGYVIEGCRWIELALERAGSAESGDLAECLGSYANLLLARGEPDRAADVAARSLTMARKVADEEREAFAMGVVGTAQLHQGDLDAARRTFEDSLSLHRRIGNPFRLTRALGNLAGVEEELGHYARAEELTHEAIAIITAAGDAHEAAVQGQNLANLLSASGRPEEAARLARSLVDRIVGLRSPNLTMAFADTYKNILIGLRDPVRAAQLIGAEEAMRDRLSLPNPYQEEEQAEAWAAVEGLISAEDWAREIRTGRESSVEDLLLALDDG